MPRVSSFLLVLAAACSAPALAQEKDAQTKEELTWRVVLHSGAYLNGQLKRQDELEIEIVDRQGNHVVVDRELVAQLECLKGSVTAKVGEFEIEERARAEVREAGARSARRNVANLSDAEAVQRALAAMSVGLHADVPLSFAPDELGRGRWKWEARGEGVLASTFRYANDEPSPKNVREIGSLIYHLERVHQEPGILWIPYRWDPKQARWALREFCPAVLQAHRSLGQQRTQLDRQAETLARLDARRRGLTKQDAARPEEEKQLSRARESYEQALRQYLALAEKSRVFVKSQAALPTLDHVRGTEGVLR